MNLFTVATRLTDTTWLRIRSQEICTSLILTPAEFIAPNPSRARKTWRRTLKWLRGPGSSAFLLTRPGVGTEARPWRRRSWVPKVPAPINLGFSFDLFLYIYKKVKKNLCDSWLCLMLSLMFYLQLHSGKNCITSSVLKTIYHETERN